MANDNEQPDTAYWAWAFAQRPPGSLMAALGVLAGLIDDPMAFKRCGFAVQSRLLQENCIGIRERLTDVVSEVAQRHKVTSYDIAGRDRMQRIAHIRHEAMYEIFCRCPHLSLPEIGRRLGGRDHTTILHGVRAHCERIGVEYASLRSSRQHLQGGGS